MPQTRALLRHNISLILTIATVGLTLKALIFIGLSSGLPGSVGWREGRSIQRAFALLNELTKTVD
jgi:hypothetical protein